ncbi:endoribonuclease Dicer homolog 4-like [Nymphaea colorata]|nr:endoribonuclease Dicer homolog 4-like [Nymphaea colorata]
MTEWKSLLNNYWTGFSKYCDHVTKVDIRQVNLLFATNVAEEGLDIQTCCLIIRFDLPSTVASYIQSRGRACMQESEYLLLVERISFSWYAQNPAPVFIYLDDLDGVTCHVVLPSNAPIHCVEGPSCASKEDAKKAASLLACKKLYELGSLMDHLLPTQKEKIEIFLENLHDKLVNSSDDFSRAELHETIVPSALQMDWRGSASHLTFHFYHMIFIPKPRDWCYRRFGHLLALPLPKEAEDMQVDLHLARGRIVETILIPSGVISFSETERVEGGRFQEMCLKLMLDRSGVRDDYVQLGTCIPWEAHIRETTPVVAHNSMDPFIRCSGRALIHGCVNSKEIYSAIPKTPRLGRREPNAPSTSHNNTLGRCTAYASNRRDQWRKRDVSQTHSYIPLASLLLFFHYYHYNSTFTK